MADRNTTTKAQETGEMIFVGGLGTGLLGVGLILDPKLPGIIITLVSIVVMWYGVLTVLDAKKRIPKRENEIEGG